MPTMTNVAGGNLAAQDEVRVLGFQIKDLNDPDIRQEQREREAACGDRRADGYALPGAFHGVTKWYLSAEEPCAGCVCSLD